MKRVLVVDDSEANLYLMKAIFSNDPNIQVDTEDDSTKVLSQLREDYPDLLVLDLMMPKLDGFQLLHQIKADPGLCRIPIVVVSARRDKKAIDKVLDYGVEEYIKKPIELDKVEACFRRLLSIKQKKVTG